MVILVMIVVTFDGFGDRSLGRIRLYGLQLGCEHVIGGKLNMLHDSLIFL